MRTLRILVVAALVAAALIGLGSAGPAVAAPATGPTWPTVATLGLSPDTAATSCPTVAVCTAAAGGELLTTADGGATWAAHTAALPTGLAAVVDLACPTASTCYLLARRADGSTVVLTGPGAGPFTPLPTPGLGAATGIACPGPRHCLVSDGQHAWATRDGGTTWLFSALPRFAYSDQQVTCATGTNLCVVFGNSGFTPVVDVTTDDGRHWVQRDPGAFDGLYALACPTATDCYVGGQLSDLGVIRRSTDAGATWQTLDTPGQAYGIRSLACATALACSAFGLTPGDTPYAWSTGDGTTFTAQTLPTVTTDPSPAVACPAAGRCRAVGGGIAFVTDAGGTWAAHLVPAVPRVPGSISCVTASACTAVGVDTVQRPLALTSTDAGVTWAQHALPAGVGAPRVVDCVPATHTCVALVPYAVGTATQYRAVVSTDLGATWTLGRPIPQAAGVSNLSCPTTGVCVAAGVSHGAAALWTSGTNGGAWTRLAGPGGIPAVNGLACTGPQTCVVLSAPYRQAPEAFTTSNLGASWAAHPLPTDAADQTDYFGFDCAATLCVAAGAYYGQGALASSNDGGVTWSAVTPPAAAQLFTSVACASATACAATSFDFAPGGGGLAVGTHDGGATWSLHRFADGRQAGGPIACAGARCYVPQLSSHGNAIIERGAP